MPLDAPVMTTTAIPCPPLAPALWQVGSRSETARDDLGILSRYMAAHDERLAQAKTPSRGGRPGAGEPACGERRPDDCSHRGRGGNAPRPLVQAADAEPLALAFEQNRAHRSGSRRWGAGEDRGAARGGTECPGTATDPRGAHGAYAAARPLCRRRARSAGHDAV